MSSREPFEPDLPDRGPAPPWAESARRELDAHADALDGATQSRLNRARQLALAEAGRRRGPFGLGGIRVWIPAGAAAALALAVSLQPGRLGQPDPIVPRAAAGALDDLELIRDAEGLELYEDQEFYAWLDESEPSPG